MSYYIRKISRAKWPEDVSEVEVKDTSLKNDENFVKLSDRKVKSIIKKLVESGRISAEQLNDTMQEKLGYVKCGNF